MWPEEAVVVPDADAAVAACKDLTAADVVLIKASRVVALDRVAAALLPPEGESGAAGTGAPENRVHEGEGR
jgi:hypothetical protein